MANNYTLFSFGLPTPEGKSDVMVKLEQDLAEEMERDDWQERYSELCVEYRPNDGDGFLWVYAEESGDVEAAIEVCHRYLKAIDASETEAVFFSWADICSKPRIGEFVGGGVIVTRSDVKVVNSYSVLAEASHNGITVIND